MASERLILISLDKSATANFAATFISGVSLPILFLGCNGARKMPEDLWSILGFAVLSVLAVGSFLYMKRCTAMLRKAHENDL